MKTSLKHILPLLVMLSSVLSAGATDIESVIRKYRDMDSVIVINCLEQPDYKAQMALDNDTAAFLRSAKVFDGLILTNTSVKAETIADELAALENVVCFYDEVSDKSDSKKVLAGFDYVKGYGLRKGSKYSQFAYVIRFAGPFRHILMVPFVKGELDEDKLKLAMPKIETDISISAGPDKDLTETVE